jgi:hypothetical protein
VSTGPRAVAAGLLAVTLLGCGTTVTTPLAQPQSAGSELGLPASGGTDGALQSPGSGVDGASAIPDQVPATGGGGSRVPRPGDEGAAAVAGDTGAVADGIQAPRGAADTRPIKVGLLYTNDEEAQSAAGVNNGSTFTGRSAFEGLVKAYNARGGFAGRRIQPVFFELRYTSSSYAADLQAACGQFTQDERVAVVISLTSLYFEGFAQCLAKAQTPQIAGDYALGDATALGRTPAFYAPSTLTTDDRMRAMLERLTASGRLTASDKLGVVLEGCPFNARTHDRTVVPTAKRLGLTIADTFTAQCFESFNGLGNIASEMQNAVLRFRSKDVTKVLFVSGSIEANYLLLFATAAESQGYRPGYALTSGAVAAVQESNTPKAQLANAAGVGWLPSLDTARSTPPQAAGKRCLQDFQSAGVTPQGPADRYFALSTCSTFALYDAVLRKSRGAADPRSVGSGLASLGTSFSGPAVLGERTDFRGGRRTGPAQARVFAWSAACECFDYVGQPFPLEAGGAT